MSRKTPFGQLAVLAFLGALTVVLLQVVGVHRRAHVPEIIFIFQDGQRI